VKEDIKIYKVVDQPYEDLKLKDLSWRRYHTGCILASCILIKGALWNLMTENKSFFTFFKNVKVFIACLVIVVNYIYQQMHIQFVKYYKLLLHISSPTCLSECVPSSRKQWH
jgi:hypothetical protein